MPTLFEKYCKTCDKYYKGRGKIYCSNKCHMNDPQAKELVRSFHLGKKYPNRPKRILSDEMKKMYKEIIKKYRCKTPMLGKKRTIEFKNKMSNIAKRNLFGNYWKGKKRPLSTILKMKQAQQILRIDKLGEKCSFWKGGISKDKKHLLLQAKVHNYNRKMKTKDLTIQIIQQVYEDNIKQYGCLICYICLKPIEFKQDCLEHKIPLSRGGTNLKDNLAIAHRNCNTKKGIKTETEFIKEGRRNWGDILVPGVKK